MPSPEPGTDPRHAAHQFAAIDYPQCCLDVSGLGADLRLSGETMKTRAAAQEQLRALEVAGGGACVAIYAGSTHERLLTQVGEVMLPQHIWQWYLRGRPTPAAAILAEAPHLGAYLESRTRHMLERLRDERELVSADSEHRFCDTWIAHLETELATIRAMRG